GLGGRLLALFRLALLGFADHRLLLVAHRVVLRRRLLQLLERLLLLLNRLVEVALLERLGGLVGGLAGLGLLQLRGLVGDVLLQLGQVLGSLLGFLSLLCCLLSLLDGLLQLLLGVLRIDLLALHGDLVGQLLALGGFERLGDFLLGVLQFLLGG